MIKKKKPQKLILYHSIIEKSQISKANTIQTTVNGHSAIEQEINNFFKLIKMKM